MNIKFSNGVNFDYINAVETEEYYNGSNRRTLRFECDANAISLDGLNSLLSNESNTNSITLTSDEVAVLNEKGEPTGETKTTVNIYDGFVLKLNCGIERKCVSAETPDSPAVYEDRMVFKLGRRTFIEEQLRLKGI